MESIVHIEIEFSHTSIPEHNEILALSSPQILPGALNDNILDTPEVDEAWHIGLTQFRCIKLSQCSLSCIDTASLSTLVCGDTSRNTWREVRDVKHSVIR